MPTYVYECAHCATQFERLEAMSAKPLERCPTCDHPVRRMPTAPAGIIAGNTTACGSDAYCPCTGTAPVRGGCESGMCGLN